MNSNSLVDNALSNSIARQIADQIILGELKPGEKLIEKEYADAFGTSRAPVREAIYKLTTEGLVERIPRKGAIVKKYTEDEIFDLLEIRKSLENLAVTRIKKIGVDSTIIEEMRQILDQMKAETDVVSHTKLNYAFHFCIVQMSKSEPIRKVYSTLGFPLLGVQKFSFMKDGNIARALIEHELIFNLLYENNFTELSSILEGHNEAVILSVQQFLQS